MLLKQLKNLITSGEGKTLEVKETAGQGVDACETLCAFLNKDGGTGVLGIGIYKRQERQCCWITRFRQDGNKSEPRNPTIARVMYSRKTVETWGRGIKLMLEECAKANLPEPQIVAEGGYMKTVFMRPAQNGKTKSTQKTTQKTTLKTTQKILNLIRQNPSITRMQISDAIGLSLEGVKWNLDKLKVSGIVRRVGPDRGGHWEIIGE